MGMTRRYREPFDAYIVPGGCAWKGNLTKKMTIIQGKQNNI
jgi:hypothetical protein